MQFSKLLTAGKLTYLRDFLDQIRRLQPSKPRNISQANFSFKNIGEHQWDDVDPKFEREFC